MKVTSLNYRAKDAPTKWRAVFDSRMYTYIDKLTGAIYQQDTILDRRLLLCNIKDFTKFAPMSPNADIGYYLAENNPHGDYRLADYEYDKLWDACSTSAPVESVFTVAQLKEVLECFPEDAEVNLVGSARLGDGTVFKVQLGATNVTYGDNAKVILIAGDDYGMELSEKNGQSL